MPSWRSRLICFRYFLTFLSNLSRFQSIILWKQNNRDMRKPERKSSIEFVPGVDKRTFRAFSRYFELSKLLFGAGDGIYDVVDIPKESVFYDDAVEMASQLGISWDGMSHEDSNRMLALLEDSYAFIRDIEDSKDVVVEVKIRRKPC